MGLLSWGGPLLSVGPSHDPGAAAPETSLTGSPAPVAMPAVPGLGSGNALLDRPLPSTCLPVRHFKDAEEFGAWANPYTYRYSPYLWRDVDTDGARTFTMSAGREAALSAFDTVSLTNNQVAGVDEADYLKTDGTFLYVQSGNEIVVAVVFPADHARIIERVPFEGRLLGLLIDPLHLVVITSPWRGYGGYGGLAVDVDWVTPWYRGDSTVRVRVYDRTVSPLLLQREVELNGSYMGARAIGDHVFIVTSFSLYAQNGTIFLPTLRVDGVNRTILPSDIGYIESSWNTSSLIGLLNMNLSSPEAPSLTMLLADAGGTLYVSSSDLFLASANWQKSGDVYEEGTLIHKLPLRRSSAECVASVRIPGHIDSQYSLDEFNGNLRVATTTGNLWAGSLRISIPSTSPSSTNAVYVLSENMDLIGRLEGLAPNETIRSARFLGERLYLVTFRTVDPFFVIDLSDPAKPSVLGYLKIPGFSEYLHPILPGLVLGVGLQTLGADTGFFQGVKLSLFDVTDVAHPREVAKLVIGDRGTSTLAMSDPHAFTWVPKFSMLVLPVHLFEINHTAAGANPAGNTWGTETWQGAYFIEVSAKDGFHVRQRVSHFDPSAFPPCGTYVYPWASQITRSFESGGLLYTVSNDFIRAHDARTGTTMVNLDLLPDTVSAPYCPPPRPPRPPGD